MQSYGTGLGYCKAKLARLSVFVRKDPLASLTGINRDPRFKQSLGFLYPFLILNLLHTLAGPYSIKCQIVFLNSVALLTISGDADLCLLSLLSKLTFSYCFLEVLIHVCSAYCQIALRPTQLIRGCSFFLHKSHMLESPKDFQLCQVMYAGVSQICLASSLCSMSWET